MNEVILVLNAGSSSIKFSVFAFDAAGVPSLSSKGQVEGIHTAPRLVVNDTAGAKREAERWEAGGGHAAAIDRLRNWLLAAHAGARLVAVGHRVVHGGPDFAGPVRIDPDILATLEGYVPLAPLHQPHNLTPIRLLAERMPELPQVACFDTAFHRTHPPLADRFALPEAYYQAGVRRYGFHGLSYEYISRTLPQVAPALAAGRVVVAHLGNGASMCALKAGRSIDSSMGFTAVDGLPMGTRSGALDPGVVLYLIEQRGMKAAEVADLLYHHSGLLGMSGISSDLRDLMASSDPSATLAIDYFVYRIGQELGRLAASLGGLDGLVFTAGIGENAPDIRARVCEGARWLGIEPAAAANRKGGPCITRPGSPVSAWVIPTDEETMIARHTLSTLGDAVGSVRAFG